jgi:Na+-transporting NADH:ubiquinone oxidoreductase subunit C
MQRSGALYTVLFSGAVCVVCSALVLGAAVSLKERQERNKVIDKQKKVLTVAGLMEDGQAITGEEITRLFKENITPRYVELKTGAYAAEEDVGPYDEYDQKRAAAAGEAIERNTALVSKLPQYALVYHVTDENEDVQKLILPVEGYGLWGTLYGFFAMENDGKTVAGLTFYSHIETPGLGGEVDNPNWKALWKNRQIYDENGNIVIRVKKGPAGPASEDPHNVDGLSGATLTSNGVTNLLHFWLGEKGFGPYLELFRGEAA